jgi:hypothetical protein
MLMYAQELEDKNAAEPTAQATVASDMSLWTWQGVLFRLGLSAALLVLAMLLSAHFGWF